MMESLTSQQFAPARAGDKFRSAVISAPGELQFASGPLATPGPGQIRVQLEGCGVCASNLPVWQGRDWFEYPQEPGAPGHEGWGFVDAVGPDVDGLAVGDRVGVLSYHAFATHDLAEAADAVPLPEALNGLPFPAEPLGCAMNIFRRSGIEAGQTVAIVGIGFLGALLTQLAVAAGAHVLAISRRPFALDVARRNGAAETFPMDDSHTVVESVHDVTGGSGCEVVVESTGYQRPLDLAAQLTAIRGRLVIAGYHQGPRTVNMQQWNWRGLDVINAHERDPKVYRQGMRAAIEAVDAGRLDPVPLLTHSFELEELERAFRMLAERPPGFLKAILRFHS